MARQTTTDASVTTPAWTLLALTLALGVTSPAWAQERPTWDRRLGGLGVTQTTFGGGAVIQVPITVPASFVETTLVLDTVIDLSINGSLVASEIVFLTAHGGTGSPCDPPCDLGDVCYCEGLPPECACGPWVGIATFPPVELQVEDEILVILRPAPGALPETNPEGDMLTQVYRGVDIGWNRRIEGIDVQPDSIRVSLTSESTYEGELDLRTELVVHSGDKTHVFEHDLVWNVGSANVCLNAPCEGSVVCAVDAAGAPTGTCQPGDAFECACRLEPQVFDILDLPQVPGDPLVVILRPVPGALPELPGFPDDDEELRCFGDLDGDLVIGFGDLLALLSAWGPCDRDCPEDLNGDLEVGFNDLLLLLSGWGPCFPT